MDRLNSKIGVDRLKTSLTVHTVSIENPVFPIDAKNTVGFFVHFLGG